jgi:hypothetical protein
VSAAPHHGVLACSMQSSLQPGSPFEAGRVLSLERPPGVTGLLGSGMLRDPGLSSMLLLPAGAAGHWDAGGGI